MSREVKPDVGYINGTSITVGGIVQSENEFVEKVNPLRYDVRNSVCGSAATANKEFLLHWTEVQWSIWGRP